MHSVAYLIANEVYLVVIGLRILEKGALKGRIPLYKYIVNRFFTFTQNLFLNQKQSEYHIGYRASSKEVLESINYNKNFNDFIFESQFLAQIFDKNYEIAEITCPTKYFDDASSINFKRRCLFL